MDEFKAMRMVMLDFVHFHVNKVMNKVQILILPLTFFTYSYKLSIDNC